MVCKAWRKISNTLASLISSHWLYVKFCYRFFELQTILDQTCADRAIGPFPSGPLFSTCYLCAAKIQSCATLILGRRIMFWVGNIMIQDGMLMPGLRLWYEPINSQHSIFSSASYQHLMVLVLLSSGIYDINSNQTCISVLKCFYNFIWQYYV